MKKLIFWNHNAGLLVCAALLVGAAAGRVDAQDTQIEKLTLTQDDSDAQSAPGNSTNQQRIVIQTVEADGNDTPKREVAWLGVAVEESSEALSSQLGLKPGEGLTVDILAPGSPAAKADFRKNDVLVELDGQMLVHPMQLRKLIRMHAEGDTVKVVFYRGGKRQTLAVKLGKTTWNEASNNDGMNPSLKLETLGSRLNGLNSQLRGMSESLAHAGLSKATLDTEIRRTMEQTRKAIRDAVRHASTAEQSSSDDDQNLDSLAHDGVDVDRDATVIVRNRHNSNRTIVQTDDSGTYVIEAGAKTHLTARNKHGNVLFDGDIDTPAQRDHVPKEVWERAEPMYDQIATSGSTLPKSNDNKSGE